MTKDQSKYYTTITEILEDINRNLSYVSRKIFYKWESNKHVSVFALRILANNLLVLLEDFAPNHQYKEIVYAHIISRLKMIKEEVHGKLKAKIICALVFHDL